MSNRPIIAALEAVLVAFGAGLGLDVVIGSLTGGLDAHHPEILRSVGANAAQCTTTSGCSTGDGNGDRRRSRCNCR